MKKFNEPTRDGFEMGYYMARWADKEESAGGKLANGSERCATCAFRQGTYPNGSPVTQMDAMKCVLEGTPFLCHEEAKPCAGWALLRRANDEKVKVPWGFSDE
jgi:hypothetical protein